MRGAFLDEVCISSAINLTRSCPTVLTQQDFGRTYHKDHLSYWKFLSIYFNFQDIGWKLKGNIILHLSRAVTLTTSHLTTLIPENFWRPYNKDHFSNWKSLAKPNGFGDTFVYAINCCLIPLFYFSDGGHVFRQIKNSHFSSMQDTPRNIHTKFGSNWPSSVREEVFSKIVNDDDGRQEEKILEITLKDSKKRRKRAITPIRLNRLKWKFDHR